MARVERRPGLGRLAAWLVLVCALASLNYAARAAGGDPPEDALYRYSAAINGVIQFGFIFCVLLLICRGASPRHLFALRRPASWGRAGAISLAVFSVTFIVAAILERFLDAGEEQGLTPDEWQPERAGAFAANAVVVVGVAPVVEELTYRGLGFSLLARFGRLVAILVVGLLFGLGHGLIEGLPVLTMFGVGLAYLRSATNSVYPPIALHAFFNGLVLALAITVEPDSMNQ